MSDYEKTSRAYLEAWRTSQAEMQGLRDLLDAERERVRVLRDALEMCAHIDTADASVIPVMATAIARAAREALATTEDAK